MTRLVICRRPPRFRLREQRQRALEADGHHIVVGAERAIVVAVLHVRTEPAKAGEHRLRRVGMRPELARQSSRSFNASSSVTVVSVCPPVSDDRFGFCFDPRPAFRPSCTYAPKRPMNRVDLHVGLRIDAEQARAFGLRAMSVIAFSTLRIGRRHGRRQRRRLSRSAFAPAAGTDRSGRCARRSDRLTPDRRRCRSTDSRRALRLLDGFLEATMVLVAR